MLWLSQFLCQRKQLDAWSNSEYIYIWESQCFQHLNSAEEEYDLVLGIHFTFNDFNCIIMKSCNPLPQNTQALSTCAEPDVYESWCLSQMQSMSQCLWCPWSHASLWHVDVALSWRNSVDSLGQVLLLSRAAVPIYDIVSNSSLVLLHSFH